MTGAGILRDNYHLLIVACTFPRPYSGLQAYIILCLEGRGQPQLKALL
jgi:hypothetical protein